MKNDSVGQLIMIGVPGKELDVETAQLFRRVQPGAFILFGRNLENAAQLRRLIDDLRDVSEIEPIITVDQEGGRVSRLRRIGSEPPNAQQLREKHDVNLIRCHGDITVRLLRLFGFNLDLCPVLDISFNDEAENSLRGRCYGRTVEEVIRNASAFNEAMREQGIARSRVWRTSRKILRPLMNFQNMPFKRLTTKFGIFGSTSWVKNAPKCAIHKADQSRRWKCFNKSNVGLKPLLLEAPSAPAAYLASTSLAARWPVSTAPSRYPLNATLVCSPAKNMFPTGLATKFASVEYCPGL